MCEQATVFGAAAGLAIAGTNDLHVRASRLDYAFNDRPAGMAEGIGKFASLVLVGRPADGQAAQRNPPPKSIDVIGLPSGGMATGTITSTIKSRAREEAFTAARIARAFGRAGALKS